MGELDRRVGVDTPGTMTTPQQEPGGVPSAVTLVFGAPRAMRAIRALGLRPVVVTVGVDPSGDDALADALLRDVESQLLAHELACRIGPAGFVALLGVVGAEHAVGRAHDLRALLAGSRGSTRTALASVTLLADDEVDRTALIAAIERANAAIAAADHDTPVTLTAADRARFRTEVCDRVLAASRARVAGADADLEPDRLDGLAVVGAVARCYALMTSTGWTPADALQELRTWAAERRLGTDAVDGLAEVIASDDG